MIEFPAAVDPPWFLFLDENAERLGSLSLCAATELHLNQVSPSAQDLQALFDKLRQKTGGCIQREEN